jgi:hypothetical protein
MLAHSAIKPGVTLFLEGSQSLSPVVIREQALIGLSLEL